MMENRNPRGSEWAKWDLQIQPIKQEWLSDVRNRKDKVRSATRDYLTHAAAQGVSVVAITDHNCGAAIDAALELVASENIPVTVLPGVELDTAAGYQLLVILNPDYIHRTQQDSWAAAIEHFLNHVGGVASPLVNADGCAEAISLDVHQFLERVCTNDIGVPVLAHAQSEKGLFKKATAAARMKFFSNCREGKYFFAIDHKFDADIETTAATLKGWEIDPRRYALIKTSDAHRASDVGASYVWIKAEKTYEGLKQVIYDPSSRLSASSVEPVTPTNIINSIRLNIPAGARVKVRGEDGKEREHQFCFAGVSRELQLSPYFNCFIGGRGSGKSTLLNFLGLQSNEHRSAEVFWNRIRPTFDPKDKASFSFEGVEVFEFIGQSEIESFATNKTAFTAAIYERASILSGDVLSEAEAKLGRILERVTGYRKVISGLERLRDEQVQKIREKKTLESSVHFAESHEYLEIVGEITKKSSARQRLESWKVIVTDLRASIQDIRVPNIVSAEGALRPKIEHGESDVAQGYIDAYYSAHQLVERAAGILDRTNFQGLEALEKALSEEIFVKEQALSDLLAKAGISEENILQIKVAPQKLVRIDDELKLLQKRIDEKLTELSSYESTFREVRLARDEFETAINAAIKPLAKVLDEQAAENDKRDIKGIGLVYSFDDRQAWRDIAAAMYVEFSSRYGESERSDYLRNYIVEHRVAFSGGHEDILARLVMEEKTAGYVNFLRDVFSSELSFQAFKSIRDSHLNDVARYKHVQVLYDGRDIEHASFGQRCTAVIVILLLFGNYPLVIDEPEAHLDSSLIANYLVPLIRRKKTNRQLIFATHNANFVVNGDSEKIVVLKNSAGVTELLEMTIEDVDHREDLLNLEGGREAFRRRGERLQI